MYQSQEDHGSNKLAIAGAAMCKMPPNHFGVNFQASNDFEKGMGVAIIVDGVLCTSEEAAIALIGKRLDDIHKQWVAHVEKM